MDSHGAGHCQDGVFWNPFSLDLRFGLRDLVPFNPLKMKVFVNACELFRQWGAGM